jgi:hypothetical protein
MNRLRASLAALALVLAPGLAAAKAPWAEIDGTFANPAHADEVDALVHAVDRHYYNPMRSRLKIEPGPHWIYIASTRASARGTVTSVPWVMKAEPCMRYLVAAQHESLSIERFAVKVVSVERIGECRLPPGAQAAVATPAPAAPAMVAPAATPAPDATPAPADAPEPAATAASPTQS